MQADNLRTCVLDGDYIEHSMSGGDIDFYRKMLYRKMQNWFNSWNLGLRQWECVCVCVCVCVNGEI